MITKLTPEQEAQLTVYRDKWIKIGLSTEPTNKERARKNVDAYYEVAGLKPPKLVVFAKSPAAAMVMANVLSSKEFWTEINDLLNSKDSNVIALTNKNTSLLNKFVHEALTAAVLEVVGKPVNGTSPVIQKYVDKLKNKWNGDYTGGNLWPGWISFYDYFNQVLKIKETDKIRPTADLALDCGWIFPYSTFCVLTEKPVEIHMNQRGQLHNEHGMSISWADGYGLFSLNGVTVPDWVLTTPRDKVDTTKVLQLPTEQRFATMRLLGLSKFLDSLNAKVIDKYKEYVLYSLTVENTKIGPYLFMKCPSSGREFLEGVGNPEKHGAFDTTITTCEKALLWRAERASKNLMTKFSTKLKYHT